MPTKTRYPVAQGGMEGASTRARAGIRMRRTDRVPHRDADAASFAPAASDEPAASPRRLPWSHGSSVKTTGFPVVFGIVAAETYPNLLLLNPSYTGCFIRWGF